MPEKRKYTKRSDYWNTRFQKNTSQSLSSLVQPDNGGFSPRLIGESFYESTASRLSPSSTDSSKARSNGIAKHFASDRFKNINDGLLPFNYSGDNVSAHDAIELCQKAYFNISAFRSTIDLLSDFADADIYLEGGSEKSRKLIEAWFNRIELDNLKAQYFREYYRSSNFFAHRIDGKLKGSNSVKLYESYGASETNGFKIPIRYLVLNPADIVANGSLSFENHSYGKVLNPFEVSRLKNPQTEHEKEIFRSLPKETQDLIKNNRGSAKNNIDIALDPKQLHFIFAKKQDYEPLAIPYAFSVLDDMNKKLELKKIDQAIARSIENVVLLITMGAEPDKGGINHKAIEAMQSIFQNESVGRVLVSDYTTKAEFIMPDLKKVMGPEKYEVLNTDIQEGLQNVLIGDTKYSDGSLKMKIFMTRLEESRKKFLKEFLQPEIKRVCKGLGLKNFPKARFVKTDTLDNSDLTKLATRMMELGILTPEQGMDVIHHGEFPTAEELDSAQDKFKADRTKGYYLPMVNSVSVYEGEEGDGKPEPPPMAPSGKPVAKKPSSVKKAGEGKGGTTKNPAPSGGRPVGQSNASLSKKNIVETVKIANEFELKAYRDFALKYGMEELDTNKQDVIGRICESIIASKEIAEWDSELAKVVDNLDYLAELDVKPDVLQFGAEHALDDLSAAILYHSTKISV